MTERETPGNGAGAEGAGGGPDVDTKGRHAHIRDDEVEGLLDHIVRRGRPRLFRSVLELLASGIIAGIEIALGVLAYLAVKEATGSPLLAGIAFGVGFVILLLGNSELFTEGFLVPVTVVAAKEATWWRLVKFWLVTLVGNLIGAWGMMWLLMIGFPDLRHTAIDTGSTFAEAALTPETFVLSILAGSTMTLLTRMRMGTINDVARILASFVIGFIVAGMEMFHVILDTLFIFGGIHAGAEYDYGAWIAFFGWCTLGNIIGGLVLTTFMRLIRSHERLLEWRRKERPEPVRTNP
ncbi:Formate/nitrite transporter FocA, FNT family [Haloechinothrix alba]|uniref:Formate/nitrite transporter FocA, FNT family n=1 Tax=Haloechinothrix alba TaxID=664784 RepID=A0A238YUF4_9PSEU|nr:formate/nitrite transporter family protein [Haloechinothrix alba]SNR74775.1 Formate/nitrite transporter FocA, FNT family [Haloechinothrix alba]